MHSDFTNNLINLVENRLVSLHSTLMSCGEDVFVVVSELLSTHCANDMVRARLWFFLMSWVLLMC